MQIKPKLSTEGSITGSVAVVGVVYAVYTTHIGSATEVGMSPSNTPQIDGNVRAAGVVSMGIVGGIALIAHDPNIFILGMAAVLVLHAHYRHQAATNPESGMLENPGPRAYQPAEYSVSAGLQAVA